MMTMEIMKVEDKAVVVSNPFNAAVVADWLDFNRDKAPATVRTYSKAIGSFLAWLADKNITRPNRNAVIDYRDELCRSKKINTARLYTSAVKIFSKWIASAGLYVDFAAGIKTPALDEESETHSREALTLDEAHAVLDSFTGTNEKSLRDKLILRLMLNCGLRSVEVTRLDTTDFEKRHGKTFLKIWGKGRKGKTARVEVSKKVYDMILDYLSARGAKFKAGEPMFTSTANRNRGARLSTQSVSKIAKATFRNVGIDTPTITCHSCRHTFATVALLNGVSIEKVQKILRHKSATTTGIYRHDITAANNDGVQIVSNLLD